MKTMGFADILKTDSDPTAALRGPFSIYLDLVRFLAALAVVSGHVFQDGLYAGREPLPSLAHDAVIIFFVLSGYVIAATAMRHGETWREFVAARFARVYSVVAPAIFLSYLVSGASAWWRGPEAWSRYVAKDLDGVTIVLSALFLTESWSINRELPWNAPFWSLCYEVWYYVIFGLGFFVTARLRYALVAIACLVAGPRILLLLPVWWLGRCLAGRRLADELSTATLIVLSCVPVVVVLFFNLTDLPLLIQKYLYNNVPGFWRFSASQRFVTDYAIGLSVAIHFLAMRLLIERHSSLMLLAATPIRFLAGYTFSLYLFHRPLTKFTAEHFPNNANSVAHCLVAVGLILLVIFLLGSLTEARKGIIRNAVRSILGGAR